MKNPLKIFFSDNFMQNHKKIFARKKDNVNFTQSTNLVNLKKKNMDMTLSGLNPTHFQGLVDGKQTGLYILVNKNGCELTLTNYGARIVSLMVPDKNGKMIDVVTGHNNIQEYLTSLTRLPALSSRTKTACRL